MLFDFFNYLYTIKNNDIYDYFNAYSIFLNTNKNLKNKILSLRMNFLIDYYLKDNKQNKFDYIYYYINNYNDNFKNNLIDFKLKQKNILIENENDNEIIINKKIENKINNENNDINQNDNIDYIKEDNNYYYYYYYYRNYDYDKFYYDDYYSNYNYDELDYNYYIDDEEI